MRKFLTYETGEASIGLRNGIRITIAITLVVAIAGGILFIIFG